MILNAVKGQEARCLSLRPTSHGLRWNKRRAFAGGFHEPNPFGIGPKPQSFLVTSPPLPLNLDINAQEDQAQHPGYQAQKGPAQLITNRHPGHCLGHPLAGPSGSTKLHLGLAVWVIGQPIPLPNMGYQQFGLKIAVHFFAQKIQVNIHHIGTRIEVDTPHIGRQLGPA